MQKLASEGLLTSHGNTSGRRYALKPLVQSSFGLQVDHKWEEGTIWRERILPLMKDAKPNVVGVCQYDFTEMLNNVIDHSGSPTVEVFYRQTYGSIGVMIVDKGIGIFRKIKQDFKLDDPTHSPPGII